MLLIKETQIVRAIKTIKKDEEKCLDALFDIVQLYFNGLDSFIISYLFYYNKLFL